MILEDTKMIQVICGEKGSGKTKQLVELANANGKSAKGIVVYIDRSNKRMHDLDRSVRLVDASHYGIKTQGEYIAFVKGMLAGNFDIETIYIDGLSRLFDCSVAEMEEIYQGIGSLSEEYGVKFVITASCAADRLPAFVAKYVK